MVTEMHGAKPRVDSQKRQEATDQIMELLPFGDSNLAATVKDVHEMLDGVSLTMCYEVLADGYYDGQLDRTELETDGPGSGEHGYWISREPVEPRIRRETAKPRRLTRSSRLSDPAAAKPSHSATSRSWTTAPSGSNSTSFRRS